VDVNNQEEVIVVVEVFLMRAQKLVEGWSSRDDSRTSARTS
jgi:hypothetical protein